MKNLIKVFILCASFYSNLLIAKNFDLYDKDGDRLFSHVFILKMAPRTAAKEVLTVPDCNDSFFGRKVIYKFYM